MKKLKNEKEKKHMLLPVRFELTISCLPDSQQPIVPSGDLLRWGGIKDISMSKQYYLIIIRSQTNLICLMFWKLKL